MNIAVKNIPLCLSLFRNDEALLLFSDASDAFILAFFLLSGVSSFNQFIHELSVDSDTDTSSLDDLSGEEDSSEYESAGSSVPPSPRSSRSSFIKHSRRKMNCIQYIMMWVLFPFKLFLRIPVRLFQLAYSRVSKTPSISGGPRPSRLHSIKRAQSLKDHIIHRATDRRRGVIEVVQ